MCTRYLGFVLLLVCFPGRLYGSSDTTDLNGRESGPSFIPIRNCGDHPVVPDGIVVQTDRYALKYQCNAFYTQVGSDTVVCLSDGSWSQLPICKEAFCVLDPAQYAEYNIRIPATEYLKDGETKIFWCTRHDYRVFRCNNRRISFTRCCPYYDHINGYCQ